MILRFGVASAVVVALLLAFFLIRSADEVAPRGSTHLVTVWDTGTQLTRSQAEDLITGLASRRALSLDRSVTSVSDGAIQRTLFVMNPGDRTSVAADELAYNDAGRSITTRYAPGRELPVSEVAGLYVTDADSSAAWSFAAALNDRGMDVDVRRFGTLETVLWTSRSVPLPALMLTALLGLGVGCVHSAVSRRRESAILMACGASRRAVIGLAAGRVMCLTTAVGLGGLLIGVPALWLYNGLAQFDRFLLAALLAVGVVTLVGVGLTVAVLACEAFVAPLAALGGKRPLRQLSTLGTVAHFVGLTVILVSVSAITPAADEVASNRRAVTEWTASKQLTSVNFTASNAEYDATEGRFARLIDGALRRDEALIVSHPVPPTTGHGPDHGNALVVNGRYLDEQTVLDERGQKVYTSTIDPSALTLLIPAHLDESRIVAEYRAWSAFQRDALEVAEPDVPIAVLRVRSGQEHFNYATLDPTSRQTDAVVAVLPRIRPLASDNWIVANATTGGVLFEDPSALRSQLHNSGLSDYFGNFEHVADAAALRLGEQERILGAGIFGLVVAGLVTEMSCVMLALTIAERRRKADFTLAAHGVRPAARPLAHVGLLFACGLLTMGTALLVSPQLATSPTAWLVVAGDVVLVVAVLFVSRLRLLTDTRNRM